MKRNILIAIWLILIEQELSLPSKDDRDYIYLPMKKDHKYGDDICYYREINEKLDYATYYVRPCEKGQYCEDEVSSDQPYGFCRDIEYNITDIPGLGEYCDNNGDCQIDSICVDNKCKVDCSYCSASSCSQIQFGINDFNCRPSSYKNFDESKYCIWQDMSFQTSMPKIYLYSTELKGKFKGIPYECGIIRYTAINDYDPTPTSTGNYPTYKRWVEEGKEWCIIGEATDGDFVTNKFYCKSGFTLKFYYNGDLTPPSYKSQTFNYVGNDKGDMCVTPTKIDLYNPVGCIITYKLKDGSEHKYNVRKFDNAFFCDKNILIQSQIYTEFIEEFNNASEEDKKNCYRVPMVPMGSTTNCENIKLLKLWYFYNHVKDYLFYKDRKDLEKVLHYKIQSTYHRYYELSSYLNHNYLFFLLILILL